MDPVKNNNNTFDGNSAKKAHILTDSEALAHATSSKTMRTKIYSGIKTGQVFQVPSLYELCVRLLQKNIPALEYTGGVPFEILKPVLERYTPVELYNFEYYNPYIVEDTNVLWQLHVERQYRKEQPKGDETYREMFIRCHQEENQKLSDVTAAIKRKSEKNEESTKKIKLVLSMPVLIAPRDISASTSRGTSSPSARPKKAPLKEKRCN